MVTAGWLMVHFPFPAITGLCQGARPRLGRPSLEKPWLLQNLSTHCVWAPSMRRATTGSTGGWNLALPIVDTRDLHVTLMLHVWLFDHVLRQGLRCQDLTAQILGTRWWNLSKLIQDRPLPGRKTHTHQQYGWTCLVYQYICKWFPFWPSNDDYPLVVSGCYRNHRFQMFSIGKSSNSMGQGFLQHRARPPPPHPANGHLVSLKMWNALKPLVSPFKMFTNDNKWQQMTSHMFHNSGVPRFKKKVLSGPPSF